MCITINYTGFADIDADYNFYKNHSNATAERQELPLASEEYDDGYKQLCRENKKVSCHLSSYNFGSRSRENSNAIVLTDLKTIIMYHDHNVTLSTTVYIVNFSDC